MDFGLGVAAGAESLTLTGGSSAPVGAQTSALNCRTDPETEMPLPFQHDMGQPEANTQPLVQVVFKSLA